MPGAVTGKFTCAVLFALTLSVASAVTFTVPRDLTSPAEAQDPPVITSTRAATYEYDVLPGLQPGFTPGAMSSFVPTGLKENCGWHHGDCPDRTDIADASAIDIVVDRTATTFGEPVYAAFRAKERTRPSPPMYPT